MLVWYRLRAVSDSVADDTDAHGRTHASGSNFWLLSEVWSLLQLLSAVIAYFLSFFLCGGRQHFAMEVLREVCDNVCLHSAKPLVLFVQVSNRSTPHCPYHHSKSTEICILKNRSKA